MVTFVAVNAQNVNYELLGYYDRNTGMLTEEMYLLPEDTLTVIPAFVNYGPETLNADDTLTFSISIENHNLAALGFIPELEASALEQYNYLAIDSVVLVPIGLLAPAQMENDQFQGYFGTDFTDFEVCITLGFKHATEQSPANNSKCVQVYRETVGISEVADGEVNVYPNPATTVINIDNAEGSQISVFDLNGRMISNVESASANQTIDASNLAKGMYIVRIANGNNVITKKVSVVR